MSFSFLGPFIRVAFLYPKITGIPRFIVLLYCASQMLHILQKKLQFALLWSITKPTVSPRYVCI